MRFRFADLALPLPNSPPIPLCDLADWINLIANFFSVHFLLLLRMNLQQVVPPRSTANGFGRRRVERDIGTRLENNSQYGKTNPSKSINAGVMSGSKGRGNDSPSRERLVYLTTCLIGHQVEVQVKDGSIFSGLFHATNADRDFGIILKMARLTRAGSSRGQKAISDSVSKGPSKTLIIPAKELVQIIAKGVSVTRDAMTNELQRAKQQDILLDSSISQSRQVEAERELERWIPDEDDPQCPELDNIFDGPWNRGWDQFEANEALFGVKSTFDEELYTTKLERGPQTRELEMEASRIAREIEGEETQDLHLAEERGIHLHENFDIDEETRFSSVFRGVDDSGYDDHEDILLDSRNTETFGDDSGSAVSRAFTDLTSGKSNVGAQLSSHSSSMEEIQSSQTSTGRDLYRSGSSDNARQLSSEQLSEKFSAFDVESRIQENQSSEQHAGSNYIKEYVEKLTLAEDARTSKSEDSQSSLSAKKDGSDKGGLSPNAVAYAPSHVSSSKSQEKTSSPSDTLEDAASIRTQGATQSAASRGRPGSSTSSTSDCGGAASALSAPPAISPSSSLNSLSSEKSTLNPHAKEFRLNPNAKSFIPTQTPLRPSSPVSDGSFYFPSNVAAVPQMHGVPIGIGPSFPGHQPVLFNPQAAQMQSPQAYFHPNGPQYGQQMILGHPRQVLYMPTYPPEMPYKGRDF
ncbi:polyadenylate-binding protein-interacting protein 4-like isoform X2 [Cornus florida]|uniref:polyadenylate-binding protein-interacting protein 4-like isoform X2 n=1 Tax=Cornus florida TaxID=4283 RepID=UPI0028A2B44B|nr:polyadenylate-binding protein-interacting protein 4-like isoform X2 [Cornus florida]